jgi:hypothetical protein
MGANKGFAQIAGFQSADELIGHHDIVESWNLTLKKLTLPTIK